MSYLRDYRYNIIVCPLSKVKRLNNCAYVASFYHATLLCPTLRRGEEFTEVSISVELKYCCCNWYHDNDSIVIFIKRGSYERSHSSQLWILHNIRDGCGLPNLWRNPPLMHHWVSIASRCWEISALIFMVACYATNFEEWGRFADSLGRLIILKFNVTAGFDYVSVNPREPIYSSPLLRHLLSKRIVGTPL